VGGSLVNSDGSIPLQSIAFWGALWWVADPMCLAGYVPCAPGRDPSTALCVAWVPPTAHQTMRSEPARAGHRRPPPPWRRKLTCADEAVRLEGLLGCMRCLSQSTQPLGLFGAAERSFLAGWLNQTITSSTCGSTIRIAGLYACGLLCAHHMVCEEAAIVQVVPVMASLLAGLCVRHVKLDNPSVTEEEPLVVGNDRARSFVCEAIPPDLSLPLKDPKTLRAEVSLPRGLCTRSFLFTPTNALARSSTAPLSLDCGSVMSKSNLAPGL
jgi:hypothetical protein